MNIIPDGIKRSASFISDLKQTKSQTLTPKEAKKALEHTLEGLAQRSSLENVTDRPKLEQQIQSVQLQIIATTGKTRPERLKGFFKALGMALRGDKIKAPKATTAHKFSLASRALLFHTGPNFNALQNHLNQGEAGLKKLHEEVKSLVEESNFSKPWALKQIKELRDLTPEQKIIVDKLVTKLQDEWS